MGCSVPCKNRFLSTTSNWHRRFFFHFGYLSHCCVILSVRLFRTMQEAGISIFFFCFIHILSGSQTLLCCGLACFASPVTWSFLVLHAKARSIEQSTTRLSVCLSLFAFVTTLPSFLPSCLGTWRIEKVEGNHFAASIDRSVENRVPQNCWKDLSGNALDQGTLLSDL